MDKKNKIGFIIGGIVLIILLLIGAIAAYYFAPVKPKKVFTTALDKVYSYTKDNNKNLESTSGKISFSTDVHSDKSEEEKILNIVNNLDLSFNYEMDVNQKKMNVYLESRFKNKEMLNATFAMENNSAYIFLHDIYEKYLQIPTEGLEKMFETVENKKEYEIVLKQVKNALNKALKDDYFTKNKTTLSIDGKNVKAIENKLILTEKNSKEIAIILSEELNNDEFIKSVSHITTTSEEKIKERLNNLKIEGLDLENGNFTISIYTKAFQHEFLGVAFEDGSDTITILKEANHYSYTLKIDKETYKGNVEIKIDQQDVYLKIYFDAKGINGSISLNFVTDKTPNISIIDTSNSIPIETLNEKDSMEILNNIQKKEGIIEFIQAITSLYSSNLSF